MNVANTFRPPRDLYGFAFAGLSAKILYRLKSPDMCYVAYANNIDHYLQILVHDQPKYILGMGTYSGVDKDTIRIETEVKNQFRNEPIDKDLPESTTIPLQPFVKKLNQNKYASALGNSWCNLVSWKIARLIETGNLQAKYTFLHIPRSFEINKAVEIIEEMIT